MQKRPSSLKILNSREKRDLFKEIKEQYGIEKPILDKYEYLERSDKIWLTTKCALSKDLSNLKMEGIGMLFARRSATLKLTTNAIQLFGKHATKNILELNPRDTQNYLRGLDLENIDSSEKFTSSYVIVKSGNDYLGCAIYKDNRLKNQLPKQRRIKKF